ncbi:MAG: VOC family protein [Maritimibacter sp.]
MIFRYTILYVEDVAASLEFYKAAFGLETGFLHESGDYGEAVTGETKLAFTSRAMMKTIGKTTGQADPAKPVFEIAFESDEVAADYARAVEAGATPVSPPQDMPWGQTISYVSDPEGILVEICSPV